MAISIEESKLSERQNKHIRRILLPINSNIATDRKMLLDCVKIYAKDSSSTDDTIPFKIDNNKLIKAHYFEIWKRSLPKLWTLQKLYFKIELKESYNKYSELLNFHIDLDISDDSYKKYPHIHIKHPKLESISNAHIALNLNDFENIANSIEKFNENTLKIFKMIEKEFISKFAK
jgi:hypothetical protein